MTPGQARHLTQAIREAVSSYDHDGAEQWYADKLCIDCDADTFWRVAEQALRDAQCPPAGDGREVP